MNLLSFVTTLICSQFISKNLVGFEDMDVFVHSWTTGMLPMWKDELEKVFKC